MKKTILEKQVKKLAKNQAWKKQAKKEKTKIFKYEFENLKKQKEKDLITKAKEKLLNEKHKKEKKQIKNKSKLESFWWLYNNNQKLLNQFAFNEKDFFIHWIELLDDEKEKKLLYIYNKIESIWKWFKLDEIEKIILENLKKRLIFEFCENFESNLKKQNSKNIKILNAFFLKSNLKKYLKNAKEKTSLNIIENDDINIFWKCNNNFESNYIDKINKKYILHCIAKDEKEKAKASLKVKKNWKKINWKELKAILKSKNKLEKMKSNLKSMDDEKSAYNLKSKTIDFSINNNKFLIKINNQIERIYKKAIIKNWIDKKVKELKVKIDDYILNWKEKKLEKAKKQLKKLDDRKKAIKEKIFWYYKSNIEKILNHAKATRWIEYWKYLKTVQNSINKNKQIQKYFWIEYWKYLKDE